MSMVKGRGFSINRNHENIFLGADEVFRILLEV